jgi:hypothetical protein
VTLSGIGGGGAVITGAVQLQGRTSGGWAGTTITLINGATTLTATTAADGTFSLPVTTILSGDYTIVATHAGYLRAGSITFTFGNTTTALPTVTLLGGDFNGDGVADVLDLGILAFHYGATSGLDLGLSTAGTGVLAPQQTKTPDFNGDGVVDVLDLGVLAGNYGATYNSSWPAS